MALAVKKLRLTQLNTTWWTQLAFDVDPVRKILRIGTSINLEGSYGSFFEVEKDGFPARATENLIQAIKWYNE